eukprot:2597043-Pyramimonas_sp.AAC.1
MSFVFKDVPNRVDEEGPLSIKIQYLCRIKVQPRVVACVQHRSHGYVKDFLTGRNTAADGVAVLPSCFSCLALSKRLARAFDPVQPVTARTHLRRDDPHLGPLGTAPPRA